MTGTAGVTLAGRGAAIPSRTYDDAAKAMADAGFAVRAFRGVRAKAEWAAGDVVVPAKTMRYFVSRGWAKNGFMGSAVGVMRWIGPRPDEAGRASP